jgi:hypothetical protein
MSGGRVFQLLGLAAVAGGGYYLYQAGGNPKVAEKKFESKLATQRSRDEFTYRLQAMLPSSRRR